MGIVSRLSGKKSKDLTQCKPVSLRLCVHFLGSRKSYVVRLILGYLALL